MAASDPELNPAQRQVVDLLGASGADRPQFDAGLRDELRAMLTDGLADLVAELPDDEQLYVNKHRLSQVHGCEARYLAELEGTFSWSVPIARGSVAHKAIELGVWWRGEPVPADLVDESIARLAEGTDGLGDWLRTCGDLDRAELRGQAVERVSVFFESFPPLKAAWRPVLEGRSRLELLGGRVVLNGKTDLSLGAADGTTAGKVLIDFKTGGFSPSHLDDLRFYALLETLKVGTPPRMLASYYLDGGRAHPEAVTEGLLHAAAARTVDGVTRMVELRHDTSGAVKRAGPACRWCPILETCDLGLAMVRGDDDERLDDLDG